MLEQRSGDGMVKNDTWLALTREDALEPGLPICDPHHHLWMRDGHRYFLDEFLSDANSGHNIVSTVFMECGAMYRADGPDEMKPVGETVFANGIAAMSASGNFGPIRVAAGIVGFAGLRQGAAVTAVLEAHRECAPDRFRGVRFSTAFDPDIKLHRPRANPKDRIFADATFREGLKALFGMGLSFDAWLYHHQIPELTDLARAFPEAPIVLDHCGGRLGLGPYADKEREVFAEWSNNIEELARCENVRLKLGGGMLIGGEGWDKRAKPVSSQELADIRRPYLLHCIDAFGPGRVMFESNFPVDGAACGYGVLWNAYKRVAADFSPDEKAAMFHDNAARFYRIAPL